MHNLESFLKTRIDSDCQEPGVELIFKKNSRNLPSINLVYLERKQSENQKEEKGSLGKVII